MRRAWVYAVLSSCAGASIAFSGGALADPDRAYRGDDPVPLQEETVMIVCMIASQIEGAKWADTHPNFWIQRATCQPAGKFAKL